MQAGIIERNIMVAGREKVLHSMVNKTFIPEGEAAPASQIGATL